MKELTEYDKVFLEDRGIETSVDYEEILKNINILIKDLRSRKKTKNIKS